MPGQVIGKRAINDVVKMLPRGYTAKLAKKCYNSTDLNFVRRIKYWRSGKMKTQYEVAKIYKAALSLAVLKTEPENELVN